MMGDSRGDLAENMIRARPWSTILTDDEWTARRTDSILLRMMLKILICLLHRPRGTPRSDRIDEGR